MLRCAAPDDEGMIGNAPVFRSAMRLLGRLAGCDATVLVEGETGTGKELAARWLHRHGARSSAPFVPVNCGAIPEQLVESELFGHGRGAFTDAKDASAGIVGVADGGTLFLDEVDALSPKTQVALLRFLQDRTFRRVGETAERRSDVRLIAASNCSLEELAKRGLFRIDLFYRLNMMHVLLPPLRERREDVEPLAIHILRTLTERYGGGPVRLDAESVAWLAAQSWPGNVRQLQNFLEREFLLTEHRRMLRLSVLECDPDQRPDASADDQWNYRSAKAQLVRNFDCTYLGDLMRSSSGNVSLAARKAGKERRDLGRMLRKYRIRAEDFRPQPPKS